MSGMVRMRYHHGVHLVIVRLGIVCLLLQAFYLPGLAEAPSSAGSIYADSLAAGWSNWSWAAVNLQASSPIHSGSHSIAVTYGAWQGLYLHHPGLATAGFTSLRFFWHGGSQGGQHVSLYLTLVSGGGEVNGPTVSLPLPVANAWTEVSVSLADLGGTDSTLTGIVLQSASGSTQPTLYIDDLSLSGAESPDGPLLSSGFASPRSVPADGQSGSVVRVHVSDLQGLADIASVTLDGHPFGRGYLMMFDDGRHNDGEAGDGVFGTVLTIPQGVPNGEQVLLVTALDKAGNLASLQIGSLEVLSTPGGQIPGALPQRIGWGSNSWSETPGQDWQVNSGVSWDYVYQYITYEWYRDGWGGNFVGRFVTQAWNKGFTPMVVVYMMLALPPTCGEGAACYAQKLQNHSAVQTYLAALQEAARQAQGSNPVIFNLEPDFYGYMQALSNSSNRPAGVQPDNPASYPVALGIPGYPDNLAGFGRRMVDVVHATAPNALVAPLASMWATNSDPHAVSAPEAVQMAQRTAAFIDAMGGAQADMLVTDWSDRDAGSGLRPWWDDQDATLPRPTRALLWDNALSHTSGKRILLWQLPVGNMSLDNTCNHYQDNRAAYVFHHPRDLFDAGIAGVLFGGGAACMTSVETDNGYVAAQGAIAYNPPSTPTGLVAGAVSGSTAPVRWNESDEPDLWGYQVVYRPASGGPSMVVEAGRRNALDLLLPSAGAWQVQVLAYDAMGHVSSPSQAIQINNSINPLKVYLPAVLH